MEEIKTQNTVPLGIKQHCPACRTYSLHWFQLVVNLCSSGPQEMIYFSLTWWQNIVPLYEIEEGVGKEVDVLHPARVEGCITKNV